MSDGNDEKKYWLDNPKNVTKVVYGVFVICALVALADLLYHKHVHDGFPWEGWFNFYGFYGFVGCVFLVLVAKWMRTFLMRDEDYYDR